MRENEDGAARPLFAVVPGGAVKYELTAARVCGVGFYGIEVTLTPDGGAPERASLPELTADRALAERILCAMARGAVTPCAAAGVAEDMMAEAAVDRAANEDAAENV